MNKSGVQFQAIGEAQWSLVRATWPHCLKMLDGGKSLEMAHEWRGHRPEGVLVLRFWTPDSVALADVGARTADALRAFDGFQAVGGRVVLEVPVNEKFHTDPDDFADLAEASVGAARTIRAAGFAPGVLVTSEGNPPGPRFGADYFLQPRVLACMETFRALGAVWCPHGYSHPPAASDEPYHATRAAWIMAQLPETARLNYLYGESGCDGGTAQPDQKKGRGWTDYFASPAAYAAWYRAKVRTIAQDPLCVGAAVFLSGWSDRAWESFDVRDEVDFRPVFAEPVDGPAITWLSPLPEVPMATTNGIDVSNHQGSVDWPRVLAAGYRFAGMKLSGDEGPSDAFVDPFGPENWAATGRLEMGRIAYHYARPSRVAPAASVTTLERAIGAVGGLRAGDNVALDVEDPAVPDGVSLHVWVAEWLALAEQVFGVTPWKYSARYYTSTHDLEHADLSRFPTWWAASPPKPAPVPGWGPIRIWQHDWFAAVPGVAGPCDVNRFDGTLADLRTLGKPAPPAVDWETPVLGPIHRGAAAVGGMPDRTPDDEEDAAVIIALMDQLKSRHPA